MYKGMYYWNSMGIYEVEGEGGSRGKGCIIVGMW